MTETLLDRRLTGKIIAAKELFERDGGKRLICHDENDDSYWVANAQHELKGQLGLFGGNVVWTTDEIS